MKAIKYHFLFLLVFTFSASQLNAQTDLMDLFGDEPETVIYETATFKTTRLVLGQSIENPATGVLMFLIQHHFGRVNTGAYEFWGLDQATIRIGLEYGINEWLAVGDREEFLQKDL